MLIDYGTLIDGKYKVRSPIGSGGMGVVYEAFQSTFDRMVALKLLTYAYSNDPEEYQRFEREAKILSRLSHPNIVQFYSYGIWHGYPYIAMQRLDGTTLEQLLASHESGLDLNFTLKIAVQLVSALQHAHSEGVFHRDIKPSNVIITDQSLAAPEIKFIDFGLAKLTGIDGQQKLTKTGQAIGSVMYMSPEQCLGQPVDGRTDIYGVGCLLFHCLTGRTPFMAENGVAIMFQHLNVPIAKSEGWNQLTPPAKQVIARCLAKQPQHRYAKPAELQADLQLLLAGEGDKIHYAALPEAVNGPGTSGQTAKLVRTAAAFLFALLFGLAAIVAIQWFQPKEPPPAKVTDSALLISNPEVAYLLGRRLLDGRNLQAAKVMLTRADALLTAENQSGTTRVGKTDVRTAFRIKATLADNLSRLRQYDQAYPVFEQAIELAKHLSKSEQADVLRGASVCLHSLDRDSEALDMARRAAVAWDESLVGRGPGPNNAARISCVNGWVSAAEAYKDVRDFKGAEAAARRAVKYAQNCDPEMRLSSLRCLAVTQYDQKKYTQAITTMKEWLAVESGVKLTLDENVLRARSDGHQILAFIKDAMGDRSGARQEFQEAIAIAGDIGGSSRSLELGMRYKSQAEYLYKWDQVDAGDKVWAVSRSYLRLVPEEAWVEQLSPSIERDRARALRRLSKVNKTK